MKRKSLPVLLILSVLLVLTFLTGLFAGSVSLTPAEVLSALTGSRTTAGIIVRTLRLPRVLGSMLSGIALSVSGLLIQSSCGNDLASPNLLGVNSGAGLCVMLLLVFAPLLYRLLPAAAFLGAAAASFVTIGISRAAGGHNRKLTLILSGVALSAFLNAGISFLSQLYPDAMASYVYFQTGGFSSVRLSDLPVPGLLILICAGLSAFLMPSMNRLCLGDDLARTFGIRVQLIRILAIILAAMLAASSVSIAGLLGFAGLIVPHMARKLVGQDMRLLLPVCILLGATLVILADLLGRTFFSPSEVSAGVLLNAIGAPFFLFLLFRRRFRNA